MLWAQPAQMEINEQNQFWTSINSTFNINKKWAVLADIHLRRNNGIRDPSFYLIRGAGQYYVTPNFTVAFGYAHMWIAPNQTDWQKFVNENRIYQQSTFTTKFGAINLLQRLRNEQRIQQTIANGKPLNNYRITNRIRYLLSTTISISKNSYIPKPVIAGEILFHFGKEIVYNTFDQYRFFVGIRQKISKPLSFDIGYMNLYQQKFSGYQYEVNHTIRLFFYYTFDFGKEPSPSTNDAIEHSTL